ncbi:HicA family toxin-antitoxin system [Bacillus sp. FSL K6-3431]|uniref:HicA family toxin-antitoxin system n=1 Tax=Bacillus sp. FSL K6-3431 TaxID=2921500 RepID=UPI0030FA9655
MADDSEVKANDLEVEPIFEGRTYERHLLKLSINENEYKGHFHEGEIQWLNPNPKQDLGEKQLKSLEAQIHQLMQERGIEDETDDLEIKPMFDDKNHEGHIFKLTIQGKEYTGVFHEGQIQWLHPTPRRKFKGNRVEKIEEKIHEKIQKKME